MCFTDDEVRKFERRVEEGYDLPDSRYELWLSIHHRESLPGANKTRPTPAAGKTGPTPAAGKTGPTPAAGKTGPTPAAGKTAPTPAAVRKTRSASAAGKTGPTPAAVRKTRSASAATKKTRSTPTGSAINTCSATESKYSYCTFMHSCTVVFCIQCVLLMMR